MGASPADHLVVSKVLSVMNVANAQLTEANPTSGWSCFKRSRWSCFGLTFTRMGSEVGPVQNIIPTREASAREARCLPVSLA